MTGMEIALIAIAAVVVVGLLVALTLRGRQAPPTIESPPPAPPTTPEAPPGEDVGVDEARGPPAAVEAPPAPDAPTEAPPAPEVVEPPLTLAERFQRRLTRTRNVLSTGIADLFGRGIDDAAWEGLEEMLISADVGVETTLALVERLRERARTEGVTTADGVVGLLREELLAKLGNESRALVRSTDGEPTVWMVTGVNGTGKTTTIGKLSAREVRTGQSVVLAAADTFRAAAADQLTLWADRTGARIVKRDEGADPAAVAFDGYNAAKATDADLLIVDTAGRLHNKRELMDELGKVKRVVEKQAGPLEETLLVLDATTGQNGIAQARAFMEVVDVTGLVLTKLDGSSKGGIVVAVQEELGLPVKLVGLGEDVDDLADFDPRAFVEGLLGQG